MPHLVADLQAHFSIALALLRRELLSGRSAARWARPAGELLVARLGVEVAVPVAPVDADAVALVAEMLEIRRVRRVARRDQALAVGERLCLVDELALLERRDRNLALAPTLAPRGLQMEHVTAIGQGHHDLDRLLAA